MLQRLNAHDERTNPDPRGDLDRWLETGLWPTPGVTRTHYDEPVEDGAPAWWHGDEEASQTFFKAMGINPTQLG